jgi:hypothetical protein
VAPQSFAEQGGSRLAGADLLRRRRELPCGSASDWKAGYLDSAIGELRSALVCWGREIIVERSGSSVAGTDFSQHCTAGRFAGKCRNICIRASPIGHSRGFFEHSGSGRSCPDQKTQAADG